MSDTDAHAPTVKTKGLTTFDDLAQDLVWPKLFKAGILAFHPGRLLLSLFAVLASTVLLWGVSQIQAGSDADAAALSPAAPAHVGFAEWSTLAGVRIVNLFTLWPIEQVTAHPLRTLLGAPLALVILVVIAGAVVRSAATEFATSRAESIRTATRLGAARAGSCVGALVGPVVLVWVIALLLAVAGFLLLRLPGLNILGAVFYGVSLLLGAVAVFLMFVYVLGAPLLIPAVCCDGADALDALQRAYAFVLARPLRLLVYLAILAAQGAILLGVVIAVCSAVMYFTSQMTGAWAGERGAALVQVAPGVDTHGGTYGAGAWIVRVWNTIPTTIPAAFLFSYACSASTLLYLGMRRVCDGQDVHELWSPQEDRAHALGAGAPHTETDADAE